MSATLLAVDQALMELSRVAVESSMRRDAHPLHPCSGSSISRLSTRHGRIPATDSTSSRRLGPDLGCEPIDAGPLAVRGSMRAFSRASHLGLIHSADDVVVG